MAKSDGGSETVIHTVAWSLSDGTGMMQNANDLYFGILRRHFLDFASNTGT
jgi:hypothetical protein